MESGAGGRDILTYKSLIATVAVSIYCIPDRSFIIAVFITGRS